MRNLFVTIILLAFGSLALNGASITLTWKDNSDNEDGFKIERAIDDGAFVVVGTVAADIVTWTDAALVIGSMHNYRVMAFNEFGNSGYTNTASKGTGLPNAPSGLSLIVLASAALGLIGLLAIFIFAAKPKKHYGS